MLNPGGTVVTEPGVLLLLVFTYFYWLHNKTGKTEDILEYQQTEEQTLSR